VPKPPPAPKAKPKPKRPPKAKPSPVSKSPAKPSPRSVSQSSPKTPDVTAKAHIPKNHIHGARERHHAFARELFAHGNTLQAYRAVFPTAGRPKKAVEANAYRFKKHPNVVNELRRLERLHAEDLAKQAAEAEKARAQAERDAIATRSEVLKFHTRVMRASSSDLTEANRDLVLVIEDKVLAPPKYDKDGEEIPNPDADADGYVTSVKRRPPDVKERTAAANAIAAMQGWNKGDPALSKVGDQLTNLLLEIRGGGKA
jgi:hypothetical protein